MNYYNQTHTINMYYIMIKIPQIFIFYPTQISLYELEIPKNNQPPHIPNHEYDIFNINLLQTSEPNHNPKSHAR